MSIRLMSQVWSMDLHHTSKMVLLALADSANDEGLCWPSISTVSKKTSLSERSVQRCIVRLETLTLLRRDQRDQQSSHFWITLASNSPVTHSHPPVTACHRGGDWLSPRIIRGTVSEPEEHTTLPTQVVTPVEKFSPIVVCAEFNRKYPGQKSELATQLFLSIVNSPGDAKLLLANLESYIACDQWRRGIVPSAENWLSKGMWKYSPPNGPQSAKSSLNRWIEQNEQRATRGKREETIDTPEKWAALEREFG